MRKIPYDVINLEKLITMKACKEGIDFLKNNFVQGFELNLNKITGEYNDFVDWVRKNNIECWFDDGNRLTKRINSYGDIETYKYDEINNCVQINRSNGTFTAYKYDERNNCVEIKHASGSVSSYKYDERNNCIEAKDSNGNTTTYKYDDRNNCIEYKSFDGGYTETYKYDDINNRTEIKYANGDIKIFKYDDRNNCIEEECTNCYTDTYVYKHNEEGNLEEVYKNGKLILKINHSKELL